MGAVGAAALQVGVMAVIPGAVVSEPESRRSKISQSQRKAEDRGLTAKFIAVRPKNLVLPFFSSPPSQHPSLLIHIYVNNEPRG